VIGPDDAPRITRAVASALGDASLRDRARRIADEMTAAPDVDEVLGEFLPGNLSDD
jgi:hypothetical protein